MSEPYDPNLLAEELEQVHVNEVGASTEILQPHQYFLNTSNGNPFSQYTIGQTGVQTPHVNYFGDSYMRSHITSLSYDTRTEIANHYLKEIPPEFKEPADFYIPMLDLKRLIKDEEGRRDLHLLGRRGGESFNLDAVDAWREVLQKIANWIKMMHNARIIKGRE